MTQEEKREKNREAQRRYREKNREKFNAYHSAYGRKKTKELQELREFYHSHLCK